MQADVVPFDPETIVDRAPFDYPRRLLAGVRDVWINGERVLSNGEHTGAAPGRWLRGPAYDPAG